MEYTYVHNNKNLKYVVLICLLGLFFLLPSCNTSGNDDYTVSIPSDGSVKEYITTMSEGLKTAQSVANAKEKGLKLTQVNNERLTRLDSSIVLLKKIYTPENAPIFSIQEFGSKYYWKVKYGVDGETRLLLDYKGNKIPVVSILPKIKIENNQWAISIDDGTSYMLVGHADLF